MPSRFAIICEQTHSQLLHCQSAIIIVQQATAAGLVNMKLLHVVVLSAFIGCVLAQRGPGRGMGPGMGGEGMGGMGGMVHNGMGQGGMGGMMNGGMGCAMDGCPGPVFMSLLNHHTKIQRETKDTDTGIWSRTTSDDPEVAALIKTHVQQMNALLESCAKGQCTHTPRYFDPLFRAVYKNADKIDMQVKNTDKGAEVVEKGKGDAAKLLVQAHAAVVSKFVKDGFSEHHKTHELPAGMQSTLN